MSTSTSASGLHKPDTASASHQVCCLGTVVRICTDPSMIPYVEAARWGSPSSRPRSAAPSYEGPAAGKYVTRNVLAAEYHPDRHFYGQRRN